MTKQWIIWLILALTVAASATAQETRDIFKTEIFLTPYSKIGDRQDSYPNMNGRVLALTGYTHYFGTHDDSAPLPRSHWSSTQPQVEGAFVLQLTERISVRTKVGLNSITNDIRNNVFSDLGINIDNLFLAYTANNYAVYGGKIDVGYGDSWHVIDGLYSGFTEVSEYRGAVGLGARYTLGSNGVGTHSIAAVWFKRDMSNLSKRWSFRDGLINAENTPPFSNKLKSYVFSYDVRDLTGLKGFSAGIDVGQLQAQSNRDKNATVLSARLRYDSMLNDRWNLSWYNETTYANAFQGAPVSNGNGVTSLTLSRDRWQLVLTAALRKMMGKEEKLARYGLRSNWDWAASGAMTYVMKSGFIVQAGLVHQRNQALTINQGVVRLAYQLEL